MGNTIKRYAIGIISFLIIWNVIYALLMKTNFGGIMVIPVLLVLFVIALVMSKKCVDFFAQEQHKKYFYIGIALCIICGVGTVGYEVSRYMPKTFEDLLGVSSQKVVEIRYEYGKDKIHVVTNPMTIENVIQYLDEFTYHLMKDPGMSQENLQANSYRLHNMLFRTEAGEKIVVDFCGYEMSVLSKFYTVEGGIVEEDKLLRLLGWDD